LPAAVTRDVIHTSALAVCTCHQEVDNTCCSCLLWIIRCVVVTVHFVLTLLSADSQLMNLIFCSTCTVKGRIWPQS